LLPQALAQRSEARKKQQNLFPALHKNPKNRARDCRVMIERTKENMGHPAFYDFFLRAEQQIDETKLGTPSLF